jgi:hypothetical protein
MECKNSKLAFMIGGFGSKGHFKGKQQKNGNKGHFKINFYAENRSEWKFLLEKSLG